MNVVAAEVLFPRFLANESKAPMSCAQTVGSSLRRRIAQTFPDWAFCSDRRSICRVWGKMRPPHNPGPLKPFGATLRGLTGRRLAWQRGLPDFPRRVFNGKPCRQSIALLPSGLWFQRTWRSRTVDWCTLLPKPAQSKAKGEAGSNQSSKGQQASKQEGRQAIHPESLNTPYTNPAKNRPWTYPKRSLQPEAGLQPHWAN